MQRFYLSNTEGMPFSAFDELFDGWIQNAFGIDFPS
jgi:hypothetical protein